MSYGIVTKLTSLKLDAIEKFDVWAYSLSDVGTNNLKF